VCSFEHTIRACVFYRTHTHAIVYTSRYLKPTDTLLHFYYLDELNKGPEYVFNTLAIAQARSMSMDTDKETIFEILQRRQEDRYEAAGRTRRRLSGLYKGFIDRGFLPSDWGFPAQPPEHEHVVFMRSTALEFLKTECIQTKMTAETRSFSSIGRFWEVALGTLRHIFLNTALVRNLKTPDC
jgi:hypothetical protein